MQQKKTLVIGLDGATWKILKPFIERGYMPTLGSLVEQGVHGQLHSTYPAMTGPAWASFATGKQPGNHGVFDFMLPTNSLSKMKFASSEDIRGKTIYELLKENGKTPILVNLPASWPPRLNEDVTITSILTQGDEWIFPTELKKEFPELQHYRLTPDESVRARDRKEEYIEDLLVHMEEQMAVVQRLFKEKTWDFFFYLFSHTDWVSHLDYTNIEQNDPASPRRVFQRIDDHLKWFVENLPENTNLVILSDHGFKAYDKVFYFNKWLEQEGYLQTTNDGAAHKSAVTRRAKETEKAQSQKKQIKISKNALSFLGAVPPLERLAKWLYNSVIKPYAPLDLRVNVGIDYANTRVCFPKGSYITNAYINKDWVYEDGTVSKEEYPALVAELVEKIKALRDPEGQPVVANVYTREEIYGGNAPDQAPDLFFDLQDYWFVGHFHSGSLFGAQEENKHDPYGIFLGVGPDFEPGATVTGMHIQDVMPTILHCMGQMIPSDCDGRIIQELFTAGSAAATHTVQFSAPTTATPQNTPEKKAIADALKKISL